MPFFVLRRWCFFPSRADRPPTDYKQTISKKYSNNQIIISTMKNKCSDLTLIRGEWLKIAKEIRPHSVDLVLCDLPFGVTHHSWDSVIPFSQLWDTYERICKPTANIVLFAVQPFATSLIASKPSWFRYDLIWVKNKPTGFLNARRRPLPKHENILIFRPCASGVYTPQKTEGHPPMHAVRSGKHNGDTTYGSHQKAETRGGTTSRYPTSVLDFSRVNNDDPHRIHPNQKPVALLEYLIKTYSADGDTVLDNTMGSGSAGLASIRCGRNFIGIEKGSAYFNAAEKWLLSESCPNFPGFGPYNYVLP